MYNKYYYKHALATLSLAAVHRSIKNIDPSVKYAVQEKIPLPYAPCPSG